MGENLFKPVGDAHVVETKNDAYMVETTDVTDAVQENRYFGDTGDKSYESLKAEASGAQAGHALSNETPGKQDALRGLEEKHAKGEITDRELQGKLGIVEASHQEFKPIGDSTVFATPAPKLAIERFVEPGGPPVIASPVVENDTRDQNERVVHHTSNTFVLNDKNRADYDRLLKEVEDLRGNRQLGDIPLSDAYWSKQNEFTLFLSNMKN